MDGSRVEGRRGVREVGSAVRGRWARRSRRQVLLEQSAQVEQVKEAALDLKATRQPGASEAAWVLSDRDDVVAPSREADLGRRRSAVGFLDGIGPVRAETGQEGHSEIGYAAAKRPVNQFRLPDLCVHLRDAAHEAFQGLATLFRSRHRHPTFTVILCRRPRSQTSGAATALQWRQLDVLDGSVSDRNAE
jgi:hypothetical protein